MARLLIANRGEIAIRIARAAREEGHTVIAMAPEDDKTSRHLAFADEVAVLPGLGARAYLNIDAVIDAAKAHKAEAVHPGYGFLSENADFAAACVRAGLLFVGSTEAALRQLGDKSAARALATAAGVPVPRGIDGPITLDQATSFFGSLGPGGAVMLKAVLGGGGRGTRPVTDAAQLPTVFAQCQKEALSSFGSGDLYAEELITKARHIEVQVLADREGSCVHAFERECTLQRSRQKLVEIAPSPSITDKERKKLTDAALAIAGRVGLAGLGTFEFLVRGRDDFVFIEANPRLQVEHTVTEEVTGLDLVKIQLRLAFGATLAQLGIPREPTTKPQGFALQARVNAETPEADGTFRATAGELTAFDVPTGPGVRVDTHGYTGYCPSPSYDSLLAKLIVRSRGDDFGAVVTRAMEALREFRIAGCPTNKGFLEALLSRPEVGANDVHTAFVDEVLPALVAAMPAEKEVASTQAQDTAVPVPEGVVAVPSPTSGIVIQALVERDAAVRAGDPLALLEAMKMEHEVLAPCDGIVTDILITPGQMLLEGEALAHIRPEEVAGAEEDTDSEVDFDEIRPDLAEVLERHTVLEDAARPEAVAKRRKLGKRTARENVAALCDDGTFKEYGALTLAAQRKRRSMEELRRMSPADGMIAGFGSVNGDLFPAHQARCGVVVYDYTVFAGTQGALNHKKKDRLFDLCAEQQLPVILFAEGGGGRPGETDQRLGLDIPTFRTFAQIPGKAPVIGVVSGRCYAGNAALLGCSDIIIATKDANVGMGGPAMIEGGGLGSFKPEEVGPVDVQSKNGLLDVVVEDEVEAAKVAKQTLSYFQGPVDRFEADDQRTLRRVVPENRMRVYQIREALHNMADKGSVLELKPAFGRAMITALVRIGGRPMGVIANDPMVLSGAIDADAAVKAADFLGLCDRYGLPVLSLCDTPGFMVGPDIEEQGQVKQSCRLFLAGANLSVPLFVVVLRKAYGLGAQAMVGGCFTAPFFAVSWPTGEFGAMGLEGAVRLGYRRELEALTDPEQQDAFFQKMLARLYEEGKALTVAEFLEIDDVIDPADTRDWILRGLDSVVRR